MKIADLPTIILPDDAPACAEALPQVHGEATLDRLDFVYGIIQEWDHGARPDALAVLTQYPELAQDDSLVSELAHGEYCARRRAGEWIAPEEFAARFPQCRDKLLRMLQSLGFLQEVHREVIKDSSTPGWPEPGDTLLGFTLLRELGRGSFARVFLAEEQAVGNRRVVVKMSRKDFGEAHTLGRLEHPNIVPINSVCQDPERKVTAVVMPYLGEATLSRLKARVCSRSADRLPGRARFILDVVLGDGPPKGHDPVFTQGSYVEGVIQIGIGLARALAFMHGRKIVHCDLKPANVLLGPDAVPRLLDFNLASDDDRTGRPKQGGTLVYMAPEQIRNLRMPRAVPEAVTEKSDLFSLGVLLYELLTGQHPFGPLTEGLELPELGLELLTRQPYPPRPLRRFNPDVPAALAAVVEQCLAFDPAARPASAQVVLATLEQVAAGLRQRRQRRTRLPRLLAGGLAAGILLGAVGLAVARLAPAPAPETTPAQFVARGQAAYQAQDYRMAVDQFTRALETGGMAPEVLFLRARAHQQLGGRQPHLDATEVAAAYYDYKAVYDQTKDNRALAGQAYCAGLLNLNQSLIQFRQTVQRGHATVAVLTDLGTCCMNIAEAAPTFAARLNMAREHFEAAVALDGQYRLAREGLAVVHLRIAADQPSYSPRAGLEHVEEAIRLGPADVNLHYYAACLYARTVEREQKQMELAGLAVARGQQMLGPGDGGLSVARAVLEAEWQRFRIKALEHVAQALKGGLNPDVLWREPPLASLRTDPAFQALLEAARGLAQAKGLSFVPLRPSGPFVDPVADEP